MSKNSFSNLMISNISKFSIDIKYFYFIIPALFVYTGIKTSSLILNWEKNLSYYLPKNILIENAVNLSLLQIFYLSALVFFSLITSASIIRFCAGIILIKSQLKVQRFFSFITTIIFFITAEKDGFFFGDEEYKTGWLIELAKFYNILLLLFIFLSLILLYISLNKNKVSQRVRISFIFLIFIIYLFYDFKSIRSFREETKNNIENIDINFILLNYNEKKIKDLKNNEYFKYILDKFKTKETTISLVSNNNLSNMTSFLTGLYPFESGIRNDLPNNSTIDYLNSFIKKYKNTKYYIYTSNIAKPSSLGGIIKNFDNGIVCDNDLNSMFTYLKIKALNYFFIFIPNNFILNNFPKVLCLKNYSNFNDNILHDLYRATNINSNKKIFLSFIDEDEKSFDILKIIEKFNETIESNKIKINLIFIDSQSLYSRIIELTNDKKFEPTRTIITQFSNKQILYFPISNKFEYQEILDEKINEINTPIVVEKRITISQNLNFISSLNLKRKYICYDNEGNIQYSGIFEKKSNKIPLEILINKISFEHSLCEKFIENSFINDINLPLNNNTFKKIFLFNLDKI
ncbi:MAG: hypothetical protein DCC88_05900 [Spirobacillus cienkowskii]|jgi:hypothetical protein|uniref:Uncharacterized protein n=1 Tax=Spirobacillus cienkowskii TaxID=495820 RepID=A0A369KSD9_9BACT|nr:MAG: hypothetical protein DCC88_05900 [Spirobacillus cienkowskii]